eukprot:m.38630 g.38630  ORF g.38630 m.38630 type:complete len:397 (-) comp11194_c0_seq3:39-1229(-)
MGDLRDILLIVALVAAAGSVSSNLLPPEGTCHGDCGNLTPPHYPPSVGTKKLYEDERQVVWDLTILPGQRCPPHEHMFDYTFHVLAPSTLAVFSGVSGEHKFTFGTELGETKAFKRHGTMMVDLRGVLAPFDTVHGVQNVGNTTYKEILVENKPCNTPGHHALAVKRVAVFAAVDDGNDDGNDGSGNSVREVRVRQALSEASRRASNGVDASTKILFGTRANHESEVKFARGNTHVVVAALHRAANGSSVTSHTGLALSTLFSQLGRELGTAGGGPSVVFDYWPIHAVQAAVVSPLPLRHVLLVKFNVDAPVGDLVEEYAALPQHIPEMKAFEWGPVANALGEEALADDYQFAFMTTFENQRDRDSYLAHERHAAFAALMWSHIEKVLVFDFIQGE